MKTFSLSVPDLMFIKNIIKISAETATHDVEIREKERFSVSALYRYQYRQKEIEREKERDIGRKRGREHLNESSNIMLARTITLQSYQTFKPQNNTCAT